MNHTQIMYTMSDELAESCERVYGMREEAGSLAFLELAQQNVESVLKEVAEFKKKFPAPLPEDFGLTVIRSVQAFAFEGLVCRARTLLEAGSYEEALDYTMEAGQLNVDCDNAWLVRVAEVAMDISKKAHRGLGEMEAYAADAISQARLYGALGLGSDFQVQAFCEATLAKIDLGDVQGAIASATEALHVAETVHAKSFARQALGSAYLKTSYQAAIGLHHLEVAEKLAKVMTPGEFFGPADCKSFREAVAKDLRVAREEVARQERASLGQTLGGAPRAELETAIDEALVQRRAEFAASLTSQGGEDGGAAPDASSGEVGGAAPAASSGEVGGAAPDASSGGKKKTRRGGKKKKKPAAEPATELSFDYSKSEDREPSHLEVAKLKSELLALTKEQRLTVVEKLNAVCPDSIISRDELLPEIDYLAMDNRTFHAFKAAVEDYLPVELVELDLPVAVDAISVECLRNSVIVSYMMFHAAKAPERFKFLVHFIRDYAVENLTTEDLSDGLLADLFDFTGDRVKDKMTQNIISTLQIAYPASQRAELRRTRAEAEAKARAEAEAARPPKPLTGAAALLQTLDEFKAKNGGVDDPYYSAMRSALEELDIEERGECPEGA